MPLDFAALAPLSDSTDRSPAGHTSAWAARLALHYARRGARTVLASREHDGPLVVQKPLYPEGDSVCHTIIVHPPAGIAGGDTLQLDAMLAEDAHVVLTTPGAGKWYRSAGRGAEQSIGFQLAPGACLEWLPQETIVFDGALANMHTRIRIASGARFIGWDILCLGRTGSGERFTRGECRLHTRVELDGRLAWWERGRIVGSAPVQSARVGLGGHTVSATMIAIGAALDDDHLAMTRAVRPRHGIAGVTPLPRVWIARYLGDSSEAAREYFIALWHIVRPALAGRAATIPRIWRT